MQEVINAKSCPTPIIKSTLFGLFIGTCISQRTRLFGTLFGFGYGIGWTERGFRAKYKKEE